MRGYEQESVADPVWALVSGLPSPKRERRLIMVLQAFIDDSGGTEKNTHKHFVLAGFIADASRWADFSRDWQAVLDMEPRLEYFKMSEASYLKGQFALWKGWTRQLRDYRLGLFTQVVRSYAAFRVSVAIDKLEFYNQVASIPLRSPSGTAGDPYYLAFHKLVLGIPLLQASNTPFVNGSKIDFVFDNQGVLGTRAGDAWQRLKNDILPKLNVRGVPNILPFLGSPPIYRDEKEFLPLQAADLYAWHVRKHLERNRIVIAPPQPVLRTLYEIPGEDSVYDRQAILGLRFDILESLAISKAHGAIK